MCSGAVAMNYCSCSIFFVAFVLFAIATEATLDSNNTTNVIHMFPPNIANATKEMISKLNDTKKSNESDNMTATKETVSELNETKNTKESGNMTVMPLRQDELLKKLNESKAELGQNGEWNSFPDLEECDPSNRCVDEKKMFIACLRVPGTDSLALSLLIENNSTDLLEIKIVVPTFVNLEQSQVQLKAKEHKKVKVSLTDGANDTTIVLVSQESHCSLNLRNTLLLEPPRTSSLFIHLLTRFTVVCFLLVAVSFLVLTYLFVKFRRSHPEVGFLYQKPDLELPVSTSGREFSERKPENWDGWHDEEAPLTPSKPLTKPLSKGLNSRKISKEGWKT